MEQAYIASPHWPTREGGFVKHSLVYHQADKTIASCNLFARIHLPGGGAGVRVKSRARPEVNVRATPTKPTQVGCKKTARQFTSGGQSHHGLKRTRTYPLSLLGEGWGEGEIPSQTAQPCIMTFTNLSATFSGYFNSCSHTRTTFHPAFFNSRETNLSLSLFPCNFFAQNS